MYEYAVSDGEGTLLMYGTVSDEDLGYEVKPHKNKIWVSTNYECGNWKEIPFSSTIIFAFCGEDCETGK